MTLSKCSRGETLLLKSTHIHKMFAADQHKNAAQAMVHSYLGFLEMLSRSVKVFPVDSLQLAKCH